MRLITLITILTSGLITMSARGQSCAGYPADQTWTAGGSHMIFESDGVTYPGWTKNTTWHTAAITHQHPVLVDDVTAQKDRMQPERHGWPVMLEYTTEESGWVVVSGEDTSFTWQLHVSEPGTIYPIYQSGPPQISIRNGTGKLELSFEENVTEVEGCTLPGWVATEGEITAGGKEIPNDPSPAERYLPMAPYDWHTIRIDLHTDQTFDAWIDGGGSDWKHVSGTVSSSSDTYIRFGLIDDSLLTHEFSSACVAWAQGVDIPAALSSPEEICDNGDIDDDSDGSADCGDTDCHCSAIDDACSLFVDILETFNVDFIEDPLGLGDIPPDWERDTDAYLSPAFTDVEAGAYRLPPHSGGPSQSLRMRIAMDMIPSSCGPGDDCMAGTISMKRAMALEDMVKLPIDWTQPVYVVVDASGSDLVTNGQWETFIEFEGYAGTRTTLEWGNNGYAHLSGAPGFRTASYAIDPGQAGIMDSVLRFGANFNFLPPATYPPDKTDIMFFENVRVLYVHDPNAPILAIDQSVFDHQVSCGALLPDDLFTITNEGGGAMTYTITDDADWLMVVPASGGPLGTGESDQITVSYDAASLIGGHTATITISSADAFWKTKRIDVSINVTIAPPDYDCDGDVDHSDFGVFQRCITGEGGGPPSPGLCAEYADFDLNGEVNQADVSIFEQCASGPEIPFDPACVNAP